MTGRPSDAPGRVLPDSGDSLPGLAWVLDGNRLTDLFGAELGGALRISHLRYKPGVSAVARVDVFPTGAVHWVAVFARASEAKLGKLGRNDKLARRARRHGVGVPEDPVLVREVPGPSGARIAVGRVVVDAGLGEHLADFAPRLALGLGLPGSATELLRFNPQRRAVLALPDRDGARVVAKVTARTSPVDEHFLRHLLEAGIPVLAPVRPPGLPRTPHIVLYPWFGDGDLARHAAAAERGSLAGEAAAAGAVLARLHGRGPEPDRPDVSAAVPARKLRHMARDVAALDRRLADRFQRLAEAVRKGLDGPQGPADRLLHGDFSADQVLLAGARSDRVGPAGERLRLADLDRMRPGPAADDLGSFAAAELLTSGAGSLDRAPLTEALLEGYATEADRLGLGVPGAAEIRAWTAYHGLARAMEPFRSGDPGWRHSTGALLDTVERTVPRPSATRTRARRSVAPEPYPVPGSVADEEGGTLDVRRAWPSAEGRITLELVDRAGRLRAGDVTPRVGERPRVRVARYGEDPRMPGLAAAAGEGRLVVHRYRRRAVVAAPGRYVKVLARDRAAGVAELSARMHGLGAAAGLAVPAVLGRNRDRVEFSVLPGRSLHEIGTAAAEPHYRDAWRAWAERWPLLAAAVPDGAVLPGFPAEDEARTLRRWTGHLDAFAGVLDAPRGAADAAADRIGERLVAGRPRGRAPAVLHRDLHDQQLLYDGRHLGVLDLDTAALGEPELDLANLWVHLDLRVDQGLLPAALRDAGREAIDAVAGRVGADPARFAVYADSARLRLACVHAFRPRWRALAQEWLDTVLP